MTQEAYLGVDIGTTSTKAVAYSLQGRVVADDAIDYPLLRPTPAAAERGKRSLIRSVAPRSIGRHAGGAVFRSFG